MTRSEGCVNNPKNSCKRTIAHLREFVAPLEYIGDFAKSPEFRWLNKYDLVPPIVLPSGDAPVG